MKNMNDTTIILITMMILSILGLMVSFFAMCFKKELKQWLDERDK